MAAKADKATSDKHSSWTVKNVIYSEDGTTFVFFDGSSWEEGLDATTVASRKAAAKYADDSVVSEWYSHTRAD